MNLQLRRCLDLSLYEIISVKKPGALLHQVIDNMETLARNFTFQDHIIVVGGRNDIDINRIPSFRNICDKLRLCAHTNVIFASVPYYLKDSRKNKLIYKFNTRLYQFLNKFNACSEGQFNFAEINNSHSRKFNNHIAASNIMDSITDTKGLFKTLKFIQTSGVYNSVSAAAQEPHFLTPVVVTLDDSAFDSDSLSPTSVDDKVVSSEIPSSDFLYPRLSQVSLLT